MIGCILEIRNIVPIVTSQCKIQRLSGFHYFRILIALKDPQQTLASTFMKFCCLSMWRKGFNFDPAGSKFESC